ncbi:MAG: DUF992 domain-containing protein [Hyphomicrobiales bacterium]|nr:DUF992 domain-containing protein [Hyphomicrobiales bacterium]
MRKLFVLAGAIAAVLVLIGPEKALARVEAGSLTCDVGRGAALVFSTPRKLHCVFHRGDGLTEAYEGRLHAAGLDAGVSGRGVIAWGVLAATRDVPPGELAGRYFGIEAGAAAVVGGRGQVLIGGSRKTIMLQPISVEAEVGLNIAVGVTSMSLHPLFRVSGKRPTVKVPAVGYAHASMPQPVQHPHYGCGSYVTMTAGQTISGYAHACGVTVEALLDANPRITNVRDISIGTPIHIPTHVTGRASPCGELAILGENENLDHLAWRCGVTLSALVDANPKIRNLADVQPGLVLAIPTLRPAPIGAPVAYAATEADVRGIPAAVPAPAVEPTQPRADYATARLELICVNEATNRYGLPFGDVVATGSIATGDNTVSVALRAGTAEAVCLVDDDGEVLFVSDIDEQQPVAVPPPEPASPVTVGVFDGVEAVLTADETLVVTEIGEGQETHESGRIEGYRTNVYALHVGEGETIRIEMQTPSTLAYFNIVDSEDTSGAALFAGEIEGSNVAEMTFDEEGVYLIRPFLVRAAARRGETADFVFALASGGAGASDAVAEVEPIPQFDATGDLNCAMGGGAFGFDCPFGVIRGDPGTDQATIYISTPAGQARTLVFGENGITTDPDGAVASNRAGDTWTINIDGDEVYEVPEAVLVGG